MLADRVAKDPGHQLVGLRSLDRQRTHVGLEDLNRHAHTLGQTGDPQADIEISDRQPEAVVGQLEDDGIVEQSAGGVDHGGVEAAAGNRLRQVAGREHLGQAGGVGTDDLDLTLTRHVPHLDVLFEVPVVVDDRPEGDRQEHVVVNRVALDPDRLDPLGEGCVPDPQVGPHGGHRLERDRRRFMHLWMHFWSCHDSNCTMGSG